MPAARVRFLPTRYTRRAAAPRRPTSRRSSTLAQLPPPRHRLLGPLILSSVLLGAGLFVGNMVRLAIVPPALPDAGSAMDAALQGKLRDELDRLRVVRDMAAAAAAAGGWVEVEQPWSGASGLDAQQQQQQLVSRTLAGMKAFGPARRWVHGATRESVTVFWLGGGLTGWPGVVHGGALATVFCEAFGSPEPASLSLTYLAPTLASNFFVLKTAPSLPVPSEATPVDGGEEWTGTLQTVHGKVCVEAKAVLARRFESATRFTALPNAAS